MRCKRAKVLLAWRASEQDICIFKKGLKGLADIIVCPKDDERFNQLILETDIIVGGYIPNELIAKATRLRLIQTLGAGVDRFNLSLLKTKGILLASASGANAITVAEHAFLLILALAKNLIHMDQSLKRGIWMPYRMETILKEVYGKNLGIIGYGRIGTEIAKRAFAFGMKVYAIKRNPHKNVKYRRRLKYIGGINGLDFVLNKSDFVVLSLPLTKETRGLIGERELKLMKKSAFLINVSRGQIVDERALYRALKEGWIAGAGLDVWWLYPPHEKAPSHLGIHELPNVIATPHKAGWTMEARIRAFKIAIKNIRNFLHGKPLINLVDYERGY